MHDLLASSPILFVWSISIAVYLICWISGIIYTCMTILIWSATPVVISFACSSWVCFWVHVPYTDHSRHDLKIFDKFSLFPCLIICYQPTSSKLSFPCHDVLVSLLCGPGHHTLPFLRTIPLEAAGPSRSD